MTSQGPLLFLNDLGSTYGTATGLQIDSCSFKKKGTQRNHTVIIRCMAHSGSIFLIYLFHPSSVIALMIPLRKGLEQGEIGSKVPC